MRPPLVQVDKGFEGNAEVEGRGVKRKAGGHLGANSMGERHRAWLGRSSGSVLPQSWRPQKRYRVSARRWCKNIDLQLRTTTTVPGLSFFCPSFGTSPWTPAEWERWPLLQIAMDQGSDGMAAMHALRYGFHMNISPHFDSSHGAHKDYDAAISAVGLRQFMILFLISVNLPHGPWRNDERWHQLRAAMRDHYAASSAGECVLFQQLAGRMWHELGAAGHQWPSERPREEEVWAFLQDREFGAKKDRRIDMCRFLASLSSARKALGTWSVDLFERTFLALEHDYLQGRRFAKLLVKAAPEGEPDQDAAMSTNPVKAGIDDRALRSCAQNAVAISVVFLSDYDNFKTLQVIVQLSRPLEVWHSWQDKLLRSAKESMTYLVSMATGGFYGHVVDILKVLASERFLVEVGFEYKDKQDVPMNDLVFEQDERADLAGQYALSLVFARQRRCLHLFAGWPHGMAAILEEGFADSTVECFMRDLEIYKGIESMTDRPKKLQKIFSRHTFQCTDNKQFIAGLEAEGGKATPKLMDFVRRRCTGIVSTQLIEDQFKAQKTDGIVRGSKGFRKPEVSFARVLRSKVCESRHSYSIVDYEVSANSIGDRLGRKCFEVQDSELSMNLSGIASTSPSPTWWSPAASNVNVPVADLFLLRSCSSSLGGLRSVEGAWTGQLLDVRHRLLVKVSDGASESIFIAGHFFQDSAVLVWPVLAHTVPAYPQTTWYEPDTSVTTPSFIAVTSLNSLGMTAVSFKWKSWLAQLKEFPNAAGKWGPRIRLFAEGPFESLLVVAAKRAFWTLPRSLLQDIASDQGIDIGQATNAFETVAALSSSILGCDQATATRVCHQRLLLLDQETAYSRDLLEIDEAIEVLDKNDHKTVKAEKTSAERAQCQRRDFAEAYKAAAARHLPRPRAVAKRGAKAPPPMPDVIQQSEAKKFIPPAPRFGGGSLPATKIGMGTTNHIVGAALSGATTANPSPSGCASGPFGPST